MRWDQKEISSVRKRLIVALHSLIAELFIGVPVELEDISHDSFGLVRACVFQYHLSCNKAAIRIL
jgi:hypothetical protein